VRTDPTKPRWEEGRTAAALGVIRNRMAAFVIDTHLALSAGFTDSRTHKHQSTEARQARLGSRGVTLEFNSIVN